MNKILGSISVSIVSHGHGNMVWDLLSQISSYEEVSKIIVTLNIPESVPENLSEKVFIIQNKEPKGFGENHNFAFTMVDSDYYCVLNPDIDCIENPFPTLIHLLSNKLCGIVAPLILDGNGVKADTMRRHITLLSFIKRVLRLDQGAYLLEVFDDVLFPDWVAGMFMLFRSESFKGVGGFDQRYFMYCEDADICRGMWNIGYQVMGSLDANVIHRAQRASHRNLRHLVWHLKSLFKYFIKHGVLIPFKSFCKNNI